jgi:2-amino-4-hydroxy-6-hydroxymethyldihydropteridine diphosphokinase
MRIILGVGSNLGDRWVHLRAALAALRCLPHIEVLAVSPVYETPPWGAEASGWVSPSYLNACVLIETALPPIGVLGACLGVEAALGRVRHATQQFAPRTIDLDVLFAVDGGMVLSVHAHGLILPHPRLCERAFALKPAVSVWQHPQLLSWYAQPHVQRDAIQVLELPGLL